MKFYRLITHLCLFAIGLPAFSQHNFEKLILKIDSSLQKQSENFPEEYILIVTDKNEYLAGETIWASFFVNNGNEPSFISKTIYAELTESSGRVIAKKMLPVENGFAHADIEIPGSISSGVCILNVYSNWMRNFPKQVSQQSIFIAGNDYTRAPFRFSFSDDAVTQISVIPEGGSFIPGVQTNFTIRLSGKNKLPVSDTFTIKENGNPIAAGRAINGLATAGFIYIPSKSYTIQSGILSQTIYFDRMTDVHLQANTDNKSKLFISIDKSAAYPSDNFLLIGIQHNTICWQSVYNFSEGATTVAITRTKLPAGVIDFYVLDENETIVAFRKIYNPRPAVPLINIRQSNNKNEVTFSPSLVNGMITVTALNTSAISTLPADNLNLFQTEKHLQHEQSFHIAVSLSETSLTLIDQLLCLQTSFLTGKKWSAAIPPQLHYMPESGIALKGKVAPYAGNAGDKGYHVELFVRGEDSTRIISRANALPNGEFSVRDLNYKKQAVIFFQGHNPRNQKELMKVELFPSYFDTLKISSFLPETAFRREFINKTVDPLLARKMDSLQTLDSQYKVLQEVVVTGKRKSKTDSVRQEYLSPVFDDGNAQVMIPDGNRYASIWHYLRNNVPGMNIVGDLLNPDDVNFNRYILTPRVNNTGEDVEMDNPDGIYFFLNEIQVSLNVISSLNLEDISLITVSKQPSPALGAYNGYISIYTKKGISSNSSLQKSLASDKRLGYSLVRNSYIAGDWRPVSASTIIAQVIKKDSKPLLLKLSPEQPYKIIISGRDKNGKFIVEEKLSGSATKE